MSSVEMFRATDPKGFECLVTYTKANHQYKVTVWKDNNVKYEFFPASYTPTFGMDVLDLNQAHAIAERLAKLLEKELGL